MKPIQNSLDRFGYSTFCDDIRFEADGRHSFIGVYSDRVVIEHLPAIFPKFCVAVHLRQRRKIFEPRPSICVFLPGDDDDQPSIRSQVDQSGADELQRLKSRDQDDPDYTKPEAYIGMWAFIVISPLQVQNQGSIKVRAEFENEIIRLGTIPFTTKGGERVVVEGGASKSYR